MLEKFIPYGHQIIEQIDIESVVNTLKSDWLTTGPAVEKFEQDICAFTGASYAVAVSSGTAALHAAMFALGIKNGDEVIVSPMSFVASSNCILYQGAKPVFADVDPNTLLIDPVSVENAICEKTKAIIAVDYAGQPCEWEKLHNIAQRYNLFLVADSCHALGAEFKGRKVGTLADISVFSFHPVKQITTCEGGMAVTNNSELANRLRLFRGHGISSTANQREKSGQWYYEMQTLGYNYRISDVQCALGSSQLKRLNKWIEIRNDLAQQYDDIFKNSGSIKPLVRRKEVLHAYHLYVVKVNNRDYCFKKMRESKIGVNVHYIPIHLQPYYKKLGYKQGLCKNAENAYEKILTLPLWAGMSFSDVARVGKILLEICHE